MAVRSRSKSVRRGDGDGDGDGGVDLISGLNDDLLLRILELLPDTRDAVRTSALSRRLRGLWTGVAALRFDFDSGSGPAAVCREGAAGAAERYVAFVNNTLALRATAEDQPTVARDLEISLDISRVQRVVPLSVEAAQGWIRYAAQQEVKSFVLKVTLPWRHNYADLTVAGGDDGAKSDETEIPVMTLDEADLCAKMESLHLRLGFERLQIRLPSSPTVVLASLTNLSLGDIHFPAGSGHLLSRLVSSACCPCLHKLHLALSIMEDPVLLIEADALLELSLESNFRLQFLELKTPILRVLHIMDCCDLAGFAVSAPRLEDLSVWVQKPLQIDDVHGDLSRVGTLKIHLFTHRAFGGHEEINDGSIHLLQHCRLSKCLEVCFHVEHQGNDVIKNRIPPLPHVISLAVRVELEEVHSSGPGVACLLAQCSNIKYLRLHLCYFIFIKKNHLGLLCDNNSCHWRSHKFSLTHLQEVEFQNLIGSSCEFQFIHYILKWATKIQKVTISFDRFYLQKDNKHAFKLMPPIEGGSWTTCNDADLSYKWRRHFP